MNDLRCFISYSSKDREIAEAAHRRLEHNGFVVWRDKTRLQIGANWSRDIALGLANSDVVCLLWSQHSGASNWVRHEWLTAYALEKFIIILLLPDAPDLPPPLFNLQGVTLRDAAEAVESVDAIRNCIDDLRTLKVTRDYAHLPPNSYIPFRPNPNFAGRLQDLMDLYVQLMGQLHKVGINQLGTVGMGGVGKTQLAVEFAYRFSFGFESVYWIQAANSDSWLNDFVELARDRLGLRISDSTDVDANRKYLIALQTYCQQHPQMLLIMDNVADPLLLSSERPFWGIGFTPLTLGCNVLFTTRKHFQLPGIAAHHVDVLTAEAAYDLLTSHRTPADAAEEEYARAICSAVGNLPLALVLAGAFLRKYHSVSFADYQEELVKNRLTVIDTTEVTVDELATRHEAAVETTLRTQWDLITDQSSRQLFQLAALFPESAIIPRGRLGVLAAIGEGQSKIDRPLEKALNILHELSLLERLEEQQSVRLHPLVREFSARTIAETEKPAFCKWAAENVLACYNNPFRLEQENASRGIHQLIGDTNLAIALSKHERTTNSQLKILNRLLDREGHNLKKIDHSSNLGASFFQQLQHRAVCMGMVDQAQIYLDAGCAVGTLHLQTIERCGVEESARIRSFAGHSELITALDWSRDGMRALIGCKSGSLTLWDIEAGQALRTLEGHSLRINKVALSNDGRRGVSVSEDKYATLRMITERKIPSPSGETTLIFWDLERGRPLHTFEGRYCSIPAACISGDGLLALTTAYESPQKYSLILWDVQSGEPVGKLNGHTKEAGALCFSFDGRHALSGSAQELIFWDVVGRRPILMIPGSAFVSVALSENCELAMGVDDHIPMLVDLTTGQRLRQHLLTNHSSRLGKGINAGCMSIDGQLVITGGNDRDAFVWEVKTETLLHVFQEHQDAITAMSLGTDGRTILSGSANGELILWDALGGTPHGENLYRSHSNRINAISMTPDGGRILMSQDWGTRVWEPGRGRDHQVGVGTYRDACISADGKRMMAICDDTIVFWYPGSFFRGDYRKDDHADSISMSWDGLRGVSCNASELRVWDLTVPGPIQKWRNDWHGITSLSVNSEARGTAAAARGDTLVLIDLETGAIVRVLQGDGDQLNSVRLSSCGKFAVSGGDFGTVRLWDVETGQVIHRLTGHDAAVNCVGLDTEHRYLVSGSADSTIILWSMNDGGVITRLFTKRVVTCLATAGKRMAFGDDSGGVHCLKIN